MLDRASGNLCFDGLDVVMGPGLTRSDFLKSGVASRATAHAANEPWHSWCLPGVGPDPGFHVTLTFENERLTEVRLVNADPAYGTSWMTYTEEKERARQGAHDRWLVSRCCVPPGTYPWGSVWSGLLNPRDRLATIVVRYTPSG